LIAESLKPSLKEIEYWDARTAWDEVFYTDFTLEGFKVLKKGYNEIRLFIAKVQDMPKWDKVPQIYWRDYSHPTFDEALEMFLRGQELLKRFSLDSYKVHLPKKSDKRLSGKLPYQVRFFRKWSRLTHSVIKQFRSNQSSEVSR
jgi:hypothetical protein